VSKSKGFSVNNPKLSQAQPCVKPKTARSLQRERIYNLLAAARGGWVPAVALGRIALAYTRNILELRRAGAVIENKIEMQPDGSKHGFYRLIARNPERSAHVELWQGPEQADLIAQPKPVSAWRGDPEMEKRGRA
jgi:hypothetical protein